MQYFKYLKSVTLPSYALCPCENGNKNNAFSNVSPHFYMFIVLDQKAIGSPVIPISDAPRR